MATNANHARSTSHQQLKKPPPPHARPNRPALSKRSSSYHAHQHKTSLGSSKSSATGQRRVEDDSDVMAASFLQFCPTCEKQIINPSLSVLYCSESCRKKDKSLSFTTTEQTPPTTPFTSTFTFDDLPTRDIVPQRSPTARRPLSFAFSETSSSSEDISSDEQSHQRSDSEAARYLQQFQSTTTRATRPRYSRGNGSSTTTTTLPSLSHTPTSTIASTSIPYTPSTRPLPPRHNPHSTSLGSRGIDLVMPFTLTPALPPTAPASLSSLPSPHTHTHTTISPSSASTLKSAAVTQAAPIAADGVLSYTKIELPERRRTEGEAGEESRGGQEKGQGQGSLKQLFRFGEMQRQPKERRGWEEVGLVRGWSTTNLEGLRRQGFDE